MSLDLFQQDQSEAAAFAANHSEKELPAGFGDTFGSAWSYGMLVSNSISRRHAEIEAVGERAQQLYDATKDPRALPARTAGDLNALNKLIAEFRDRDPSLTVQPLSEDEMRQNALAKSAQAKRDYEVMSGREKTFGGAAGAFAGRAAGAILDPINIGTLPFAAPEASGVLGAALIWGAIGAGGQLATEALNAPYREEFDPGYSSSAEPARNILEAGAFGAVLGGGVKGAANLWTRYKTGSWPRTIRDAGNAVESEAQIANTNRFPGVEGEVAHRTALQKSIDDLVAGRPVDVDQVVTPSILQAYERRLSPVMEARGRAIGAEESAFAIEREGARLPPTVERLSEQQLLEIRAASRQAESDAISARGALDLEGESIVAARGAQTEREATVGSLQREVQGLNEEIAALQSRIGGARDAPTQARLAQIEQDLSAPALPAARRAQLEAERDTITATVRATAARDERLIGSLNNEMKGLQKAQARAQKNLQKAEARAAREADRIAAREGNLPVRREATEQKFASRKEMLAEELRKSISRLAKEGYEIRLPTDDARQMANSILAGGDDEAEAAARAVTESLVERRLAAKRAAPEPALPFGTEQPVAQQRARATYHTEEMRKAITALAREVGYEMPREEAAAIAAQLAKVDEHEALAILDELMLRPRTLAETLPGTGVPEARVTQDALDRSPAGSEMMDALARDTSPQAALKAREAPETQEAVLQDLDRLRATKDIEIPTGVMIDANGRKVPIMSRIDDVISEAEARELAAREIQMCAAPQPEAAS